MPMLITIVCMKGEVRDASFGSVPEKLPEVIGIMSGKRSAQGRQSTPEISIHSFPKARMVVLEALLPSLAGKMVGLLSHVLEFLCGSSPVGIELLPLRIKKVIIRHSLRRSTIQSFEASVHEAFQRQRSSEPADMVSWSIKSEEDLERSMRWAHVPE